MPPPRAYHTNGTLAAQRPTGRVRLRARKSIFRTTLVTQVEIMPPEPVMYPKLDEDVWARGSYTFWRDAQVNDMATLPAVIGEVR